MPSDRPSEPQAPSGPRDREGILDATMALLDEHGYRDLTIEGVAARSQVHKTTIYRWWSSKRDLVGDALASRLATGPVPDTGDIRQDLIQWLQITLDNYTITPAGSTLPALLSDLAHEPKTLDTFRESFLEQRRANCTTVIKRGIERDQLPTDLDIDLFMDILAGTVFYRQLVSGVPVDSDLAEQIVDLLLSGQLPTTS